MKGLLRKDIYQIKRNALLLMTIVIVAGISAIALFEFDPSPLAIILPAIAATISIGGIGRDKTSKWEKFAYTFPIKLSDYGKSKYILYILFTLIFLILSILIVMLGYFWGSKIDKEMFIASVCLGLSVSLINGAIVIPFALLYEERKIAILRMTSLFISSMFFVALTYVLNFFIPVREMINIIYISYVIISMFFYYASWEVYKRCLLPKIEF